MRLEIDALKEVTAWRTPTSAPPVVLDSQIMAAGLHLRAIRPQDCTPGVDPVNGKETQ